MFFPAIQNSMYAPYWIFKGFHRLDFFKIDLEIVFEVCFIILITNFKRFLEKSNGSNHYYRVYYNAISEDAKKRFFLKFLFRCDEKNKNEV